MKQMVFLVMMIILLPGCGTAKSTADEQMARAIQYMEETNSSVVIYQQQRSRGLFADMIDSTFKTITGQNNDTQFN